MNDELFPLYLSVLIRPRAPCTQHTAKIGPQPLLSLQMLISVNIFLEGNEGVKERRLQNDQRPPKCQRFFMKDNPYLARAYLPEFAKMKNQFLWALTKVSRRNQVICSSFAFPGFVGTAQHSYDFQIQVVLAQRFSFHYCPGSGSDLFLPLLVAPCRCLLRAVVHSSLHLAVVSSAQSYK